MIREGYQRDKPDNMIQFDFVTFLASLGTIHSLFFSILLWFRQKQQLANRILAAFFFATSIRIAKNIVVHIRILDPDIIIAENWWRLGINVGLIHQLAIGPLFYLYFRSLLQEDFSWKRNHLWHLLPYGILLPIAGLISWPWWRDGGLYLSYLHVLIYYLLAFTLWLKSQQQLEVTALQQKRRRWLGVLLVLAALLMLIYSPALFKYTGYIGGAILYAIGIYVVSVGLLKEQTRKEKQKYTTSALSQQTAHELQGQLLQLMEKEQFFLDSTLSLSKLAKAMHISPTHLSQVINQGFQQSYATFVNNYRLQEVANKLKDPKNDVFSIASLAFDSGFNSLSTFNTLFKKTYDMTPSKFRSINRKT